jgi:hypothetical protein
MAQWRNGAMVQWCNGAMVQWFNGRKRILFMVNSEDKFHIFSLFQSKPWRLRGEYRREVIYFSL